MRTVTILAVFAILLGTADAFAQKVDFAWMPSMDDPPPPYLPGQAAPPYLPGLQSGARQVAGPYDLDGDGKTDILVADYSGGGRVHVIESTGTDTWELVYSSPVLEPTTGTTNNLRAVAGSDLDGDGMGEILAFAGYGISDTNPLAALISPALFVIEAVGDNDFNALGAFRYDFDGDLPDRWRTEQMTAVDVDGDGVQELLFANNGAANEYDSWYVFSVTGDLPDQFATFVLEQRWSSRASEDYDPVNRGGGSPFGMIPANLDGGSEMEIAMQSWNNFNFTNARVTGPDTYETLSEGDVYYQAASQDHVALFGCAAVDMDGNGDDEVYCPRINGLTVPFGTAILNYEDGEDALSVTADNVVLELLPDFLTIGITAGDIDMDGNMELIGAGPGYSAAAFEAGDPPSWIRIVDYDSGDVEDPANYSMRSIPFPDDMVDTFDRVVRDSAGTVTEYRENGAAGAAFTSKLAFLGDPDGDGYSEVAFAMQSVSDSIYVYDEVFNPADSTYTRTVREAKPNPNRVFLRVLSGDGISVDIVNERVIVPSDYVLHGNYPNPFNPSTTFSFTLPIDKQISVRIYDVTGRMVRTLIDGEWYAAGTHQATWDGNADSGSPVASGTYLYTLEYGNFRQSRTMLLVK